MCTCIINYFKFLLYLTTSIYIFIVYNNLMDLKLQFPLQDFEQRIFAFVKIKIN